jgi:hypothetical protein
LSTKGKDEDYREIICKEKREEIIQEKITKNNRGAVFPCYSTWPGQSRTRKKDPTGIVKLLRCK